MSLQSAVAEPAPQPLPPRARWRWVVRARRHEVVDALVSAGVVGAAIVFGLAVSAAIISLAGHSPVDALQQIWQGAFGTSYAIGNTLNVATPLLLVAVGFLVAYRAGLINVGAEGQIYLGGAAAAAVALKSFDLSPVIAVPAALLAAALAGAAWSGVAGWWRARMGVSEIISTLLMNFIAIQAVSYMVKTPSLLQETSTGVIRHLPQSALVPENTRLALLFPTGTNRLHMGFLIACGVAVLVALAYRYTPLGFQLRLLGHNASAARQAGVRITAALITAMLISGAIGGLAGGDLVLGDQYRILNGISPGYGFDGIVVALLARSSALNAIWAAILFAALRTGGLYTETAISVPSAVIYVIQGVVVLTVAGAGYYLARRRLRAVRES